MNRVLKNISTAKVNTTYNGKKYIIEPKGSITLDHNGRDEQAADYLLQTFGFLKEITVQKSYPINTEGTYERKIRRDNGTVKVVKEAQVKAKKARGKKVL